MFALHHKKSFVPAFLRSLLITYLMTLSLEKEIIVLENSLEKALNFGSRNLYQPCRLVTLLAEPNVCFTYSRLATV